MTFVIHLGLRDRSIAIFIQTFEQTLERSRSECRGRLFEVEQSVTVGVMPLDPSLNTSHPPFGLPGIDGCGEFTSGKLSVSIDVGLAEALAPGGPDSIHRDPFIAILAIELKQYHRPWGTVPGRTFAPAVRGYRPREDRKAGQSARYRERGSFHVVLHSGLRLSPGDLPIASSGHETDATWVSVAGQERPDKIFRTAGIGAKPVGRHVAPRPESAQRIEPPGLRRRAHRPA